MGAAALAAHRAAGVRRRLVMGIAPQFVPAGAEVRLFGEPVGVVANSGFSTGRDACVVLAFVDVRWAHPGIDAFEVGVDALPLATVTPPLPDNLSIHVNLQRDAYAARDEIAAPPLFGR